MHIVLCTGGFDPIHSGHIEMLKAAREFGEYLIVGVNSDEWLTRKKGKPFMPHQERMNILQNIGVVGNAFGFDDSDGSANDAIRWALGRYKDAHITFANGGDRTKTNIPEMDAYADHPRVSFEFGIGGTNKANSSSWILSEWKSPKTERPWGYYRNLHQDGPGTRVKELTVAPHQSLSMQKHYHRSEFWMCTSGQATVRLSETDPRNPLIINLNKHDELHVPVGTWHQLINETDNEVKIVEIQYGDNIMEEDIERIDVDKDYGASLYDN